MLLNLRNANPFPPFGTLSRELDRMFGGHPDTPAASSPPVRVWETDDGYEVEAVVPGVVAADLDVSVHGKRVTLRGERKEVERENATALRREWGALQFERSFDLATEIDGKGVVAELRDGVLHLSLPKAAEHKPRKIKIQAK